MGTRAGIVKKIGRPGVLAVASALAVPAWPSASAQPSLAAHNSVGVPMILDGSLQIAGAGCGVPATGELPMPAGALNARVQKPTPGATGLFARVTDVALQEGLLRVTAVGEGHTCDPTFNSVPPASRPWSEPFEIEVPFKRREMVAVVAHWRLRGGLVVRPSQVALRRYTTDATDTVRNIRWRQYGGRKAVGVGIFKAAPFFCPAPDRCAAPNGRPVRVELTRPSYCGEDKSVGPGERAEPVAFYGRVAAFAMRQTGTYKPGTNFQSYDASVATCSGPVLPIP